MKPTDASSNIPDKLQYLRRIKHRFDRSSAAASAHQSVTSNNESQPSIPISDSNCSSGFRIQSEKESFLDVFSCRRPVLAETNAKNPVVSYDMRKYFSKEIEQEIQKVMHRVEKVEQERKVQRKPAPNPAKEIQDQQIQAPKTRQQNEQPVRDRPIPKAPLIPEDPTPSAFPTEQTERKQCSVCLRWFNQASFTKHASVCQKVFFKKRKQFNSADQRLN